MSLTNHGGSPTGSLIGGALFGIVISFLGLFFIHQVNLEYSQMWDEIQTRHIAPQTLRVQAVTKEIDSRGHSYPRVSFVDASGKFAAFRGVSGIKAGEIFEGYHLQTEKYLIPRIDRPVPAFVKVLIIAIAPLGILIGILGFCKQRAKLQ